MASSSNSRRTSRRRSWPALAAVLAVAALGAGCIPDPAPPPPPPPPPDVCDAPAGSNADAVAVMGACPRVSLDQLVTWFEAKNRPAYRASVPVRDLVKLFLDEGRAEGVRGDIAFMQSIIETGWFNFSGRVPPSANNFSGLGATDSTTSYGVFFDARHGVRAQIQHLRAYADASSACANPPLANPCVDVRFNLVTPRGKAPTWNQFGGGVWATDPTYAGKVLGLYRDLLERYGLGLA